MSLFHSELYAVMYSYNCVLAAKINMRHAAVQTLESILYEDIDVNITKRQVKTVLTDQQGHFGWILKKRLNRIV